MMKIRCPKCGQVVGSKIGDKHMIEAGNRNGNAVEFEGAVRQWQCGRCKHVWKPDAEKENERTENGDYNRLANGNYHRKAD